MKLFSMQFTKVLRVDTILCAVMLVFSLSGCSLFDDSDGKLQQIGLEEEELHLSAAANVSLLNTKTTGWGIGLVKVIDDDETTYQNGFYSKQVNGNTYYDYYETMAVEWFEVKKEDNRLQIKLDENTTGKQRQLIITLRGGVGYKSTDLVVYQSAE